MNEEGRERKKEEEKDDKEELKGYQKIGKKL
jgi:hypothetical protein